MKNKKEIKCSCDGKNVKCYRCGGWGYFIQDNINIHDGNKRSSRQSFVILNVTSKNPIQQHDIELRVNEWSKSRRNVEVVSVNVANTNMPTAKKSVIISVIYKIKSPLASSSKSKNEKSCIYCYPVNYDSCQKSKDATKGIGFVARENGKYGSFPTHDDYSDESEDE